MPIRPSSSSKKGKKKMPKEDVIDPHQEQIDGLVREREDIRTKLNIICLKIIENTPNDIDLSRQQPSDISLELLLALLDDLCLYRSTLLNISQETDDEKTIPVSKRITQLSVEDPELFRKRLTLDQRLTFVARERDLWKENAQFLQIMYATIVDQLEMNLFQKSTNILRAHRLNLQDVCRLFSAPTIRSLNDAQKLRTPKTLDQQSKDQHEEKIHQPSIENENQEHSSHSPPKTKRTVSFSHEVNIINRDDLLQTTDEDRKPLPSKPSLPSASETFIEQMDPNLRMLIVKELGKETYIEKPPSKLSSTYTTNSYQQRHPTRHKSPDWVELARLIGIEESEIDHWLAQNLQYPAGRVISTWCNSVSPSAPSPTVAELHSFLLSNQLNRLDLARRIEAIYNV